LIARSCACSDCMKRAGGALGASAVSKAPSYRVANTIFSVISWSRTSPTNTSSPEDSGLSAMTWRQSFIYAVQRNASILGKKEDMLQNNESVAYYTDQKTYMEVVKKQLSTARRSSIVCAAEGSGCLCEEMQSAEFGSHDGGLLRPRSKTKAMASWVKAAREGLVVPSPV